MVRRMSMDQSVRCKRVGMIGVPVLTSCSMASSSVNTQCSMVSTPACMAMRWVKGVKQWQEQCLFWQWASSTTASSSSWVMLRISGSSASVPPPPEAQVLMKSTPRRSCLRASFLSSQGPSAVASGSRRMLRGEMRSRCEPVMVA